MQLHNPPESLDSFQRLLAFGVDCALDVSEFILGLHRFHLVFRRFGAEVYGNLELNEPGWRALGFGLFREIWNHVPRPELDWRTKPMPKPERNGACPCGSLRKYKQCCGSVGLPVINGENFNLFPYVIDRYTKKSWKTLPFKKMPPEALAVGAQDWIGQGRAKDAALLLEAMLAPTEQLDERHEFAFDILCDAYLELGNPIKRIRLAERLMTSKNKALRAAAMQRRCTMYCDKGDYASAWTLFHEAQRWDPENLSLAHLEVVMLVSQDRMEEAQGRAAFWLARLGRRQDAPPEMLDWLRQVASDPSSLATAFHGDDEDMLLPVVLDQLSSPPEPEAHHRLTRTQDGRGGMLSHNDDLHALYLMWKDLFFHGEESIDEDLSPLWQHPEWPLWLADHAQLWHCFEVLEDILTWLDGCDAVVEPDSPLIEKINQVENTLLNHGVALLHCNLRACQAENLYLECDWRGNEAPLRILSEACSVFDPADTLPLMEWAVLRVNPADDGNVRQLLMQAYLQAGQYDKALRLNQIYRGDDSASMRYGQVLALFGLGRLAEAETALQAAYEGSPHIIRMLLTGKAKGDLDIDAISVGSKAEAVAYYWTDYQAWKMQAGALAWLKRVAPK